MTCQECQIKMVEQKRSFHKKWICPKCSKVRMQQQREKPPKQAVINRS